MSFSDVLFLLAWGCLPFVWHVMMKAAGLSLLRPTLPSFLVAAFYVYQYLGIPLLYFQLLQDRVNDGVTDTDLVLKVWFYTSVTITLMLLGALVANRQFGVLKGFKYQGSHSGLMTFWQAYLLFALGLLSCGVLYLYLQQVGFQRVALFVVLDSASGIDAKAARSAMGNAFEGKYHWYRLFMREFLSFVWLAFFAQYLLRPTKAVRLLLVFFGVALLFSLLMATEKGPVSNFLVAALLALVWVRNSGNVSLKKILIFAALLTFVLSMTYFYFMGDSSWEVALNSIASRLFAGQIQPAYHYLEYFPAYQDWLWGRSFPNPGGILPFEPLLLTQELANWHNPEHLRLGIQGSMPAVYWGEMYANFGLFGILAFPLLVGYLLYAGNWLLFTQKFSPMAVALFAWLLIHYHNLSGTGLSSYVMDIELFLFIALYLFVDRLVSSRHRPRQGIHRLATGT